MKNILAEIVEEKKIIVKKAKEEMPLAEIRKQIVLANFGLSHKLRTEEFSLIAECKLQSPSKGRLCDRYTIEELASIYEQNGASALSVHTDPHFLGKNADLKAIKKITSLPIMRKDFIIDEYQIYESRMLGANAILLIARILTENELHSFLYKAWSLGMDVIIEVHDEDDMKKALGTPAEFIGINNRNLITFETSIENTLPLLSMVDDKRTIISESGISSYDDCVRLRSAGCDGILVGEGLVKAADVARQTRLFSNPVVEDKKIA
ncbi:MAG: indole-3-glycerol phosphate synthase TrpC [Selenomonadaceae bacterium]